MRDLDEKRIGLLIRMKYHRTCVCKKKTQAPLLRRGLTRTTKNKSYEITPDGNRFVDEFLRNHKTAKIETYPGISIGDLVMILTD